MKTGRIFLVGLSGSGKSAAGPLLAGKLGWRFTDSDREIERQAGCSVQAIFARDGEARFRELEAGVLDRLSRESGVVVSTGGGAMTTLEGREAIGRGFSIWLNVSPSIAAARLAANPDTENRPLLGDNPEARLTILLLQRHFLYARADATLDVDDLDPAEIAAACVDALRSVEGLAATVVTANARYPVLVQEGLLARLGEIAASVGCKGRAYIVTDANVGPRFAPAATRSLEAAGIPASTFTFEAGEVAKTLATVERVYEWLIAARAERGDFLVCLGGGVVTDLGGFVAATYLRGVRFLQVPTSLLGMVDAAVGGKTGVDLPAAKNMAGVFAQPAAVVIDPDVLDSLPERELRSGWAEVLKHGLILDEHLLADLEAVAGDPQAMRSTELIGRSVAIKAAVVSEDERESDRRTLLNYGHTVGHAIEAVTGYAGYLHGEAVAIGMHAAGRISVSLGLLSSEGLERQQSILERCGLPSRAPGVPLEAVLDATLHDKKVRGGAINWVVLERLGHAVIRNDVPAIVVREALDAVLPPV